MGGLKAQDYAAVRDWPGYYAAMQGKPPRQTLLDALALFEKEESHGGGRRAIDLGCGQGRDTLELLQRGWEVTAIDDSPAGLELLTSSVPPDDRPRLGVEACGFPDVPWERLGPGVDLVNASYALPFCPPGEFAGLWRSVVAAIRPGGRFAGQFFGDRDGWASMPDRTHHRRGEVERLLGDFLLESFREVENDEPSPSGLTKHWHLYHVVAKKR